MHKAILVRTRGFASMPAFALLAASFVLAPLAVSAAPPTPPKGHIVREDIEWLDVWLPNTNNHDLPRVLLIGDSITRGYGPRVEENLKGVAYVSRIATSKSLGDPALMMEIALVLQEQSFDIIHFNNGLHGKDYTPEEYAAALPILLAVLHHYDPDARLVWASSTDVRQKDRLDVASPETERVIQRNAAAAAIVTKKDIPVDDLFALIKDHSEYHVADGVHFNDAGYTVLAAQVVKTIKGILDSPGFHPILHKPE
jgi:lysophospholipase L1-like esterase